MPSTVVVVQSDDLATWVGSFAGLAGVVVGFWLERWSRKRDELRQLSRDIEHADLGIFGAYWMLTEAVTKEQATGDSGWVQVRSDKQMALGALIDKIAAVGSPELASAAERATS